jgi:hypothetical protein
MSRAITQAKSLSWLGTFAIAMWRSYYGYLLGNRDHHTFSFEEQKVG